MSLLHAADNRNIDSMVYAAANGNNGWVKTCLDAGVDINGENRDEHNACYAAITKNRLATLKLLVEHGANLHNLLNLVAIYTPNVEMAILLLDAGAPIDDASTAAALVEKTKSIVILQRILSRGLDLSGPYDLYNGRTLCHLVSYSIGDVSLLLNATVNLANNDVNARDLAHCTPLHNAAHTQNLSSICTLVELGADVDAICQMSRSPLHYAITHDSRYRAHNSIYILLALGANVCWTTCVLAAIHGFFDVVAALMAAGFDIDQIDSSGDTARSILLKKHIRIPCDADVDRERKKIAKKRLDLVRNRALQICIALQSLQLPALLLCEILKHMSTFSSLIEFHQWWAIATRVKHYSKHY
jgi:ankyrin repeat protein